MLLFFCIALAATLIPVFISHRQKYQNLTNTKCQAALNAGNSIAGGVLLATCFIALVPLVEHSYNEVVVMLEPANKHYPYAQMTILFGLFLVIFIEQFVGFIQKTQKELDHSSMADELETLFTDEEETTSSEKKHEVHGQGHSHSHSHHNVVSKSLLHSVILVITLGLHTLFEGMAIGLVDDINWLITLVLAVVLHESCCAVALGVNLGQQSISRKTAIVVCVVFSLMMPVGIGMGLALGSVRGLAGLILTAILQGVATGTFIYVLFIEIIPASISNSKSVVHLVLMFCGCALMTLIIIFTHSHGKSVNHSAMSQSNCTVDGSTVMPQL
ncbi:hypothetical protein EB796_008764 [Bugula neritina]|uniref:SLC39A1 n=1 Tax=Bugula neritina TaxID=10212 RepID=A0A7J7K5T1_BUGNE|nr:hypothetical protein EB796_008764 [Bugula neritina]